MYIIEEFDRLCTYVIERGLIYFFALNIQCRYGMYLFDVWLLKLIGSVKCT